MKFDRRIYILIPLILALLGCSLQNNQPDHEPTAATAVPQAVMSSSSFTTPDELDRSATGKGGADALILENSEQIALDYWEELTIWDTEISSIKQKDIDGVLLCVEYSSTTGDSIISVNGQKVIHWTDSLNGGNCCLSGKFIDQNGTKELVLFIWPAASNVAAGDVHVFSIRDSSIADILTIGGRKTNVVSEGRSDTSLYIPDDFDYSVSQHAQSGLNEWCFGVTVIEYEDVNYLRILHSNQEKAYTYMMQDGEQWHVLQQIILPG